VALAVFIFVITRPFLVSCVWGVCGSFHGASQVFFFGGGHFGEIGPFYAHFSPEASKRDFLGSEILFFATGAAGDGPRPAWGSALQPTMGKRPVFKVRSLKL
jgi:hypothetical protein